MNPYVGEIADFLGALLLYTAIKIARHKSEDIEPDKTLVMRAMRR